MTHEAPDSSRGARLRDAAVVLPVLGAFLLMPPIIALFAGDADAGVPRVVAYLFGVWLALIVAAAWLARRLRPRPHEPHA
jgi:membrane protein implicated in regulation of membrane protease activity